MGGIALFGGVKGSTSFGEDYFFMSTLRYTYEGERSLVAMPADDLLKFAVEKEFLKTTDADAFKKFVQFGAKYMDADSIKSLTEKEDCKIVQTFFH